MCVNNSRSAQTTIRSVQIDDEALFHHSDSGRSSEQMVGSFVVFFSLNTIILVFPSFP